MYRDFGYLYNPEYASLFCDNELTDLCRTTLKEYCEYIPYCIIRHEHPGYGATSYDALYARNQTFWNRDLMTYIRRKSYPYEWSILIPTMPGREASLQRLMASIREKTERLAPLLRVELCVDFDNRESSIGVKRNRLLHRARGKYVSFIDDDDDITDAYVEDVLAMFQGGFQTMRLCGSIGSNTFFHSIAITLKDPMAVGDVFQRCVNHLNPMLADIAKLVSFKDATYGEDMDWTVRLCKMGFVTSEYCPDDLSRVHYIYNLREPLHPSAIQLQRTTLQETMLGQVFTPVSQAPAPAPATARLTSRGFVFK
jgi:glycosyltransferase involved in cell wall biosynthesis